jgi:hypothetical protein
MPMRYRLFSSFAVAISMVLGLATVSLSIQETIVAVSFQADQFDFEAFHGYDRVRLAQGGLLSHPGEPTLPAKQLYIAIPAGHEVLSVAIRSVDIQDLPGRYQILPGQPPLPIDDSPRPAFIEPDERIYSSSSAYPSELGHLIRQTDLAGQQMAVVSVYPLQYIPATGKLILHRELEVTVETRPGRISGESYAQFTEKQRQVYGERIRKMVVNPEDVVLSPPLSSVSKSLPSGQFDHVIITHSSYVSYFDDLVEWHNRRGLRDTVVTTSWIDANYAGDDTTRVRSFIIDAHSNWGTMYFLLGGEEPVIPFCYRQYVTEPPYPETPPSDTWYADYDDDWTWEVMVGRISGQFEYEFNRAIDKIIKYERNPPLSDYILEALFIGMDYDATMYGEDLKEEVALDVPPRFTIKKVYDSHITHHLNVIIAQLNAGKNLVNHADHCNWYAMGAGWTNHGWLLQGPDVDALTNTDRFSNVVAEGCWPAAMPEEDCMAEHFLFHNVNGGGGVSFCGNTRVGYTDGATQTMGSSAMERGWWKALMVEDLFTLGEMVAWTKHQHNQDLPPSDNYWKHCEWQFVLAGDPAMPIWTDTPESLDVTHPNTLPGGSSSFTVHVESEGGDLQDAYVCLWKPGEVYLTDYTDPGGDVIFTPSPATPGSLYVTVTKHNYLPYQGDAQVTDTEPLPVTDLAIQKCADDLVLTWTPPDTKTIVRYVVYRNTESDFVPAAEDSIGDTADTLYIDANAAGGAGSGYYYAIRTVSDSGGKSEPSNCVGEFGIELLSE